MSGTRLHRRTSPVTVETPSVAMAMISPVVVSGELIPMATALCLVSMAILLLMVADGACSVAVVAGGPQQLIHFPGGEVM